MVVTAVEGRAAAMAANVMTELFWPAKDKGREQSSSRRFGADLLPDRTGEGGEKAEEEISLARSDSRRSVPNSAASPHRLARLGHYPFTVRTGVRIPVGTPFFRVRKRL